MQNLCACQIYVDNSDVSKAKIADALSIIPRPLSTPAVTVDPVPKRALLEGENVVYKISINVGENPTCSGLSLFGNI